MHMGLEDFIPEIKYLNDQESASKVMATFDEAR